MAVTLRTARPEDVPVLEHWDSKPHVIACTGSDDVADWHAELEQQNTGRLQILIAEQDGRPIGVLQIIDPDREVTRYWGDIGPGFRAIDIWIGEEADLGQGYGTRMMKLAHEICFMHDDVKAIILDPLVSNQQAHRFYERLGYRRIERRQFGEDDCYVYQLDRDTGRACKSTGQ